MSNVKRIGIFGDSFGDWNIYGKNTVVKQNQLSWPYLLKKLYFNVFINEARAGTGVFYAYKKFMQYKHACDVIIFIVTEANRLHCIDDNIFVPNLKSVENKLSSLTPDMDNYEAYKAAEMYYKYLFDKDLHIFIRDSVMNTVMDICNKEGKQLILVPAFSQENIPNEYFKYFEVPLVDISNKEYKTQFNSINYKTEKNTRACHFSAENNSRMASYIKSIIDGKNIVIGLDDFVYKKVPDPENYWDL